MDIDERDRLNKKIREQARIEYINGHVRPLICYALDPEYLPDHVWEFYHNPINSAEFKKLYIYPYLMLILWVRFFYEKCNGRDVWACLPEKEESKDQLRKCVCFWTENFWKNDLITNEKIGEWFRWIRSQCWVIAAKEGGITSVLLRNNERLSGWLGQTCLLSDYVTAEWGEENVSPYIKVIAEKYPEEVKLVLKSLCGEITQYELTVFPWLNRINDDVIKDKLEGDWVLRNSGVFLEIKGNKKKITLGGKSDIILSNGGLRLESVQKYVSNEEIGKGIVHRGRRLPSFNLNKPQIFLKKGAGYPRLINTENPHKKISSNKTEVFVYLPKDYPEKVYSLDFIGEPVMLTPIEGSRTRIYKPIKDLKNIHTAPLHLIDPNGNTEPLHCFSKYFGISPRIVLAYDYPNKKEIIFDNLNSEPCCYVYGRAVYFQLDNSPPLPHISWVLEKDGAEEYRCSLGRHPEYEFLPSKNGIYDLSCRDENDNVIASLHIIYIEDIKNQKKKRIEKNKTERRGFAKYEVAGRELLLPVLPGEGSWQWHKQSEPSENYSALEAKSPDAWLDSKWELRPNVLVWKDGVCRYDANNILFNNIPLSLIVQNTQNIFEYYPDNFLEACFCDNEISSCIYRYFNYGKEICVIYNTPLGKQELFKYINTPWREFRQAMVLDHTEANSIKIWYPNNFYEKKLKIDGITKKITHIKGYLYSPVGYLGELSDLQEVTIGAERLYPVVNREVDVDIPKSGLLFEKMSSWLRNDSFNFLSCKKGDQILEKRLLYYEPYYSYLLSYLNPSTCIIRSINHNNQEVLLSTLYLSVILERDNKEYINKLKNIYPDIPVKRKGKGECKNITIPNIKNAIKLPLNDECTTLLNSEEMYIDSDYIIALDGILNEGDIFALDTLNDLTNALKHTSSAYCNKHLPYELVSSIDIIDKIYTSYQDICEIISSYRNKTLITIAEHIDHAIKLSGSEIDNFIMKIIFCCRIHARLIEIKEMKNYLLPLDTHMAQEMNKCLMYIVEHVGYISTLMTLATIFEKYSYNLENK